MPILSIVLTSTVLVAIVDAAIVTGLPADVKWDYQLTEAYTPATGVNVVERDHDSYAEPGLYNICFINAFQTQKAEKDFWITNYPDLILKDSAGAMVASSVADGQYLLDTSTDAKRQAIAAIMYDWIDICALKGFNAIDADNLDSYTHSNGLLTQTDNLLLAKLLADHAHSQGLAIAQKNTPVLGTSGKTVVGFDFAIAAECQKYGECCEYVGAYGTNWVDIEYDSSYFENACSFGGDAISIILRDPGVLADCDVGYVYQEC